MPRRSLILTVVVMIFWGLNFVVIDEGLKTVPALLFASVRYVIVAFPAILWVKKPNVPWRNILAVGTFLSAGQMGLLYLALHEGMPAGLASLICQVQMVFTIAIAIVFLGERPTSRQLLGAAIAFGGIVVIAAARGGSGVPVLAFALSIGAAASWGIGNVLTRVTQADSPFGLLIWSSLVPPIPLALLSLAVDGPHAIGHAFAHWTFAATWSALYTAVLSTLFGYGAWTWLLSHHEASRVAPFTLLVPPVGIAAAWIFQGEDPTLVECLGAIVVLFGLALLSLTRNRRAQRVTSGGDGAAAVASAATGP